ncbi:MAG: hypothetical protein Q8O86_03455 [Dehalococcoidia bacterium]|nr:hypothetical protein [Dehalococcoidia bacterium]
MRIGSDGLGKRLLDFHFEEVASEEGGELAVLKGKTTAPVIWKITLHVQADDIPNLIKTILSPPVIRLVAKYFVRRALSPLGYGQRLRSAKEELPLNR